MLNRSYQELAEHYGTAIVPARVRKPDDKAAVEGTVRHVSTWITAALRDTKFFSLEEARRAVIEKLEELNRRPFKKRPGSRVTAFEEEERQGADKRDRNDDRQPHRPRHGRALLLRQRENRLKKRPQGRFFNEQ